MTVTGKTFATAWDAVAETPEAAAVLKARTNLMIADRPHQGARLDPTRGG